MTPIMEIFRGKFKLNLERALNFANCLSAVMKKLGKFSSKRTGIMLIIGYVLFGVVTTVALLFVFHIH